MRLAFAVLSNRVALCCALKDGGRSIAGTKHGTLQTIVIVEVALAVILLAGAGVLLRSFRQQMQVNPGFDTSNLLTMNISLPATRQS